MAVVSNRNSSGVSGRSPAEGGGASVASRRRIVVVAWAVVAVFGLAGFLFMNLDWERRARAKHDQGVNLLNRGQLFAARDAFAAAIVEDPRNAAAHLQLGGLYDGYLPDNERARYHYKIYLAQPGNDPASVEAVESRLRLIDELISGKVEDPADAAREIVRAARDETLDAFLERARAVADTLSRLRRGGVPDAVWAVWARKGYADEPVFYRRSISVAPAPGGGAPRWTAVVALNWDAQPPPANNPDPTGFTFDMRLEDGLWRLRSVRGGIH